MNYFSCTYYFNDQILADSLAGGIHKSKAVNILPDYIKKKEK